ncbi:ABC transporter substrate-binding protein [Modestobacter sp. I12A-02628]|uniref:ABC transporter substrate-binding protein n=1 Tax=Goekera deserti TaxID=2497753 RepID=A0A7K3WDU1_9ACTN|nr:ABC transporter substrate-binding protein [Goekera deserti]MPQ98354.1 ABC transporter substrate-binding protein [Goekera deserti]NDI48181.1 ABC transporter substrate-binding protein [Goekera deserti]NEL53930.1 ABC transporter substrate-binding protein [Goekera deserti]
MSRPVRSAVTAAALVLTGLLTACGSTATDAAPSPAAAVEEGFPRTVTHDKGTTELPDRPTRVVALDNSLVEAVVALDVPLVGGIGSYRDQQGAFPEYLGDAVADTEDVGPLEQPALERIAALQPDLILSATVRHDELYEQLSQIAPTVFVATTGPSWKDNIRVVGEATGTEERAEELIGDYEERAAALGAAVNAAAGDPTVSMVRFVDGPTRLYAKASFSGIVFQDMGLARPAPQDVDTFAVEVSEEEIRLADGDHIFVSSYSGGAETAARVESTPLWTDLAGVKAGNVHRVEDAIWMTSVSLQGAHMMMDDMAEVFGVDPQRS